jgi:inner membrane transporter RhtA
LLAAACWAGYILVNRVAGARLPGSQGPAAAAGLSALLYVPVGIWALASHPVTAAGLLCSAVPMVADTLALRQVPPRFFGVFMSVNPVFAALTGLIVLGQSPGLAGWLAIAAIVTANTISVSAAGRPTAARQAHGAKRDHGAKRAHGAGRGGPGAGSRGLNDPSRVIRPYRPAAKLARPWNSKS